MAQGIIVFEVNEVPLRIFGHFSQLRPKSHLHELMSSSNVLETVAKDVPTSFLYPSQTWASLNIGAPYACHNIHWYHDPKPDAFPLYWKILATHGLSVGAINTLHSSPGSEFAEGNRNYKFLIPDCFAADTWTRPLRYQAFQALNLKAVKTNSRAVSMRVPLRDLFLTTLNAPRYGIRAATIAEGTVLMTKILRKKVNRERLRNLQFPLVTDIFLHEFRKHKPNLAILFTNHVAANLHRYWYSLFPEDYKEAIYDEPWVDKYSREIAAAVDLLDTYIGILMELARSENRILVVVSSMGQQADPQLTREQRQQKSFGYRLDDPRKLATALIRSELAFKVESAMVPQYVLAFQNEDEAKRAVMEMREALPTLEGVKLTIYQNREIVTLSTMVSESRTNIELRGKTYTYSDLGYQRFQVDDHHSGCHAPEGSLIIYNSSSTTKTANSIDYLEYAPAMLSHFGLALKPYMVQPTFRF